MYLRVQTQTQPEPRMNALEQLMASHIAQNGPMGMSEFMALALGHPEHGYYMGRDPFGQAGDFTTAPEISQMFGEMIGAWFADMWMKGGAPSRLTLLECGPGRGTLMADMLRATSSVPGFHDALDLHLLETSPVLRARQKETLSGYNVRWHDTIETVPDDAPFYVIGNEFFDALPVQQFIFQGGRWHERRIDYQDGRFCFVACEVDAPDMPVMQAPGEGAVYECSPLSLSLMTVMAERVAAQGGAMLFVDYGYDAHAYGDTLQAVRGHDYVPVLEQVGACDLSAHVNFAALAESAQKAGLQIFGPAGQGAFLQALGIDMRAKMLQQKASDTQRDDIQSALGRLTGDGTMGRLFRVLCACPAAVQPEGF